MCDVCENCVYYFKDTDFCLNHMYSVMLSDENCSDKKRVEDYSSSTFISNEELDFSEELYDWRDEEITIEELFKELKRECYIE